MLIIACEYYAVPDLMAMQVLGLRPCEGKDGLSTPALADNIMTGIKAPPQVRSLYLKHLAV